MDKDILECILKKNWKDATPEKVVSLETVPAVRKFVNFLSSVNRCNLKVILKNGRTAKKSIIIKTANADEVIDALNRRLGTFKNETIMYGIFKEFEYLMEEYEDFEDVLWCKMIHHIPYTCIVLEDLKAKGFSIIGKEDIFDLEQGMVAIHALGRYHGMCKILEEMGLISPQEFRSWFIFDNYVHQKLYWGIVSLVEGIKKLWDPSWIPLVDKIKITKESFSERLKKLSGIDETKFNLLNHGDCHKNNILFKFDYNRRPIAVRFVDFQMVHYGSPCIDLAYYIYLSLQPPVRRDNFHLLMRTYYNSLLNTLDKYKYKGNRPSFDEIIEGTKKYSFIGLVLFFNKYPNLYMTEKMGLIRDMEKIVATDGKEGFSDELFKPERLEDGIGTDLKIFIDSFF